MSVTTTELHPSKRLARIETLTAKYIADGMPPAKAKKAAERKVPQRFQYTIRLQRPDGSQFTERKAGRAATAEATQQIGEGRELEILTQWFAPKPVDGSERKHPVPTLSVWLPKYRDLMVAAGLSDHTIKCRVSNGKLLLTQLGADTLLSAIDADALAKLQTHLRTLYSDAHRSNVLQTLSNALRMAIAHGYLDVMPCVFKSTARLKSARSRAARIERNQFWVDAEFFRLLEHAPHLRAEACFVAGRDAGLRAGEMLGLEWPDILDVHGHFPTADSGEKLRVLRSRLFAVPELELKAWRDSAGKLAQPKPRWIVKLPKSGKARELPYTARLRNVLRKLWLASGSPLTGRVFGDVRRKDLSDWLATAERAAGLPTTPRKHLDNGRGADSFGHLHKLRHSFCSGLAMRGVPVDVIRKLAGHHSITVTEGYMWLAPGAEDSAVAALDKPMHASNSPKPTLVDSTSESAGTETKHAG